MHVNSLSSLLHSACDCSMWLCQRYGTFQHRPLCIKAGATKPWPVLCLNSSTYSAQVDCTVKQPMQVPQQAANGNRESECEAIRKAHASRRARTLRRKRSLSMSRVRIARSSTAAVCCECSSSFTSSTSTSGLAYTQSTGHVTDMQDGAACCECYCLLTSGTCTSGVACAGDDHIGAVGHQSASAWWQTPEWCLLVLKTSACIKEQGLQLVAQAQLRTPLPDWLVSSALRERMSGSIASQAACDA